MKPSHHLLNELIGREGFAQFPAHQLFRDPAVIELVVEKVSTLDPDNFCQQQLAKNVRFLVEVLRETLSRRYQGLSVLAFAHVLVALDYVVRVADVVPDTHAGGYTDDLQVVTRVLKEFEDEFDRYRDWKLRRGEKW